MSKSTSPLSISLQPGRHLSIDSRPGTAETARSERPDLSQEVNEFIQWNSSHLKEASIYVTSPFKQGPQKRYQDVRTFYDVSSPMKHEVVHALSVYKKTNSHNIDKHSFEQKNKTFYSRKSQGRLLPLLGTPVVKGPNIKQCIGIASGNKKLPRSSKNYQRHCLHSGSARPKMSRYPHQSSIHHTSVNSLCSKDQSRSKRESTCSESSASSSSIAMM